MSHRNRGIDRKVGGDRYIRRDSQIGTRIVRTRIAPAYELVAGSRCRSDRRAAGVVVDRLRSRAAYRAVRTRHIAEQEGVERRLGTHSQSAATVDKLDTQCV